MRTSLSSIDSAMIRRISELRILAAEAENETTRTAYGYAVKQLATYQKTRGHEQRRALVEKLRHDQLKAEAAENHDHAMLAGYKFALEDMTKFQNKMDAISNSFDIGSKNRAKDRFKDSTLTRRPSAAGSMRERLDR